MNNCKVFCRATGEQGQCFTKFITAEDGTEFAAVAYKFSFGIRTLAECLMNSSYSVKVFSDKETLLKQLIPISEDLLTWCIEEDKKFIYSEKIKAIKEAIK